MEYIHKFEAAGLGKAPYKFVGMYTAPFPGTSCDYCGTHIRNVYSVRSEDGKKFKVGCDCIYRVWAEAPNKWAYQALVDEVKKAEAAHKKAQKEEKFALRFEATMIKLEEEPKHLTNKPHPNSYYATKGKTLRDYVEYLLVNGGTSGRERAFKLVEE